MIVRTLRHDDVHLVARIDRSEHVDIEYAVVDGELRPQPARMPDIPAWEAEGDGPHSVAAMERFCREVLTAPAVLLGAFRGGDDDDERELLGLAIVDPVFEPPLAWLALLHVSRPHRRRGVASALWSAAVEAALAGGADAMYVSATPTDSAVSFYLSQGCQVAVPPHPRLLEHEPEDIHLVRSLRSATLG